MQLLIDTDTESRHGILAAINMLESTLTMRPNLVAPDSIAVAPPAPAPSIAPVLTLVPPPPPPAADELDPSVFRAAAVPPGTVPPPPPPPPAPVAPVILNSDTAPPSAPKLASPSELDAEGLPWDERIHSSTKNKTKDGSWKTRRNLADGVYEQIVAELRAGASAVPPVPLPPSVVPAPPLPPGVPAPPAPVAHATGAVPPPPPPPSDFQQAVAPQVPPPPPPVMVPPPPDVAGQLPTGTPPNGLTFRSLMQKIHNLLQGGKLKSEQITEACKSVGIDGLQALVKAEHLLGPVDAAIERLSAK